VSAASPPAEAQPKARWRDGATLIALALIAALASQAGYERVNPDVTSWANSNYWFDSDAPLVFGNLTNQTSRYGDHANTRRHPAFVLLGHGATKIVSGLTGAPERVAVGGALAGSAALAAALLFALLRTLGLRRRDATLFTLTGGLSAASLFWFSVPETYPFAVSTILAALLLVARADQGRTPNAITATVVAAATLAVTSTNWTFGLLMLFAIFPWRRASLLSALSLGAVVASWGIQREIAPSATFFLGLAEQDTRFFFHPEARGPAAIVRGFFSHAMVMPGLLSTPSGGLSVQAAAIGSAGPVSAIGAGVWLALLGYGGCEALRMRRSTRFVQVLGAATGMQLALHLVFGRETFLYTLHFAPLLILIAATGATARHRDAVAVATAGLCVLLAWNNIPRFTGAADRLKQRAAPQVEVPAPPRTAPGWAGTSLAYVTLATEPYDV
jgi:hypothetical protein